jgi:Undecaprenyl-phosphate glucose phosphotransferase
MEVSNRDAALNAATDGRRVTIPCEGIPYLLSTIEAGIIVASSMLAAFVYHVAIDSAMPSLLTYFAVGLMASFVQTVRLSGRGYYDFEIASKPGVEMVDILVSWVTSGMLLAFFAFVLKIGVSFSRGSFLIFMATTPVFLLSGRKLAKHVLARAVANGSVGRRSMVLIGDPVEMTGIEPRELLAYFGAGQVNRFTMSRAGDPARQLLSDQAVLDQVAGFVRRHGSSDILVALPWSETDRIARLREQLKFLPVSTRLLPDTHIRALTSFTPSAGQRALSIELQRAPLSLFEQLIKRCMDIVLSALALVLLSPLFLFTAIAIKLNGGPGPVIFRQNRKGFNGARFEMLKFRTMTVMENGDVIKQASRDDPRITPIGALLRASSIDELPQLVNVLRGEMSLIGPRPHAIAHDNEFEKVLEDYAFRHHVKPGMTGWAQVHGLRGATPSVDVIANRVKLDLWYINNWSLWLDIQVIFRTFFEVLRKRNAY